MAPLFFPQPGVLPPTPWQESGLILHLLASCQDSQSEQGSCISLGSHDQVWSPSPPIRPSWGLCHSCPNSLWGPFPGAVLIGFLSPQG